VIEWLSRNGMSYWTPSPLIVNGVTNRIIEERRQLGLDYVIQKLDGRNPMLFFEMGMSGAAARPAS